MGRYLRGAMNKSTWASRLRHVAYSGGWKKLEPMWDLIIRSKRVTRMLPLLEATLDEFGGHKSKSPSVELEPSPTS